MLRMITLQNWASYEYAKVDLSEGSVLLTGDNGAGKSALIEAIPYALFGIARKPIADMVRKVPGEDTADRDMSVELLYDGGHTIIRGRRADGKGIVKVLMNAEITCQGDEANAWIEEWLGYSKEMYLLTSYYKSRGKLSDGLMYVTSSERWNTLQRVAQLALYQKAEREAKVWQRSVEKDVDITKARVESLEQLMCDEDELKKALGAADDLVDDLTIRLGNTKEKQKNWEESAKDYNAVSVKWDAAKTKLDELRRQMKVEELTHKGVLDRIDQIFRDRKRLTDDTTILEGPLRVPAGWRAETEAALKKSIAEHAKMEARAELLTVALEKLVDGTTACPLCNGPVSEHTSEKWEAECDDFNRQIATISKLIDATRAELALDTKRTEKLALNAVKLTGFNNNLVEANKQKVAGEAVLKAIQARVAKGEQVVAELKEQCATLRKGLPEVVIPSVAEVSQQLGSAEADLATQKRRLGELKDQKKMLKERKAELVKHQTNMKAALLLTNGFGKYGIPKEILTDFIGRLGQLATEAYSNFNTGEVRVEVSEGDKPTVDFVLSDWKGKRDFDALSDGEQIMVYISVRVALSQIMVELGSENVDWLILDEIMSALTPERRDELMKVVVTTLRKVFPRLVVVTHVPVREVFDRRLTVTVENGLSVVA